MIAEGRKRFNTWTGGLFITLGFISFGLAGWIAAHPQPPKPHPVSGVPQTDRDSCRAALSRLSFVAQVKSNDIVVQSYQWDEDPEGTLLKASLGMAVCKTMVLKNFCMGEGCNPAGISFTLTGGSSEPEKVEKKDAKKPAPATPKK